MVVCQESEEEMIIFLVEVWNAGSCFIYCYIY